MIRVYAMEGVHFCYNKYWWKFFLKGGLKILIKEREIIIMNEDRDEEILSISMLNNEKLKIEPFEKKVDIQYTEPSFYRFVTIKYNKKKVCFRFYGSQLSADFNGKEFIEWDDWGNWNVNFEE